MLHIDINTINLLLNTSYIYTLKYLYALFFCYLGSFQYLDWKRSTQVVWNKWIYRWADSNKRSNQVKKYIYINRVSGRINQRAEENHLFDRNVFSFWMHRNIWACISSVCEDFTTFLSPSKLIRSLLALVFDFLPVNFVFKIRYTFSLGIEMLRNTNYLSFLKMCQKQIQFTSRTHQVDSLLRKISISAHTIYHTQNIVRNLLNGITSKIAKIYRDKNFFWMKNQRETQK